METPDRVDSLDVLRGFDMFWIIGGTELIIGTANLFGPDLAVPITDQLTHVEWIGFTFYDLIMPLFLFIVGAVMPFSLKKLQRESRDFKEVHNHIFYRFILLYILGFLVSGGLDNFEWTKISFFNNTLQAIGCAYLMAALAMLYCSKIIQGTLFILLLLTYWGIVQFVPGPDFPAGTLEPQRNIAIFVDRLLFGVHQQGSTYSWILSCLTFTATVLSGVFSGYWLAGKRQGWVKVCGLFFMGIFLVFIGWSWGKHSFPIIKHIWTSSMVLFSSGLCLLLCGFFYLFVDLWGIKKPFVFFRIIGLNGIFAYVIWNTFGVRIFPRLYSFIFHPIIQWNVFTGEFLVACCGFVSFWAVLFFLYKRKVFIRI